MLKLGLAFHSHSFGYDTRNANDGLYCAGYFTDGIFKLDAKRRAL